LRRLLLLCCYLLAFGAWAQDTTRVSPTRRPGTVPFGMVPNPLTSKPLTPEDSAKRRIELNLQDSLRRASDLETRVDYYADDSTISNVDERIVELFGNAKVDYGDIHLTADYIRLNWKTNEVYARGTKDSTGKMRGEPIFESGQDKYNTNEIRYNFKSRRSYIKGIVTKQGEGNVRGTSVKKDSSNNFYIRRAFYTTCDLVHPHYGISAPRIKLVQGKGDNKQVISGPFNLVIADVPLPLGLPFGFFPFSATRKSGIIVGNYGEEPRNRGFYLRDFGYYWAVNDNLSLRFTGQIYSRGGWGVGTAGNYLKRYRYSGNFNLIFNKNSSGEEYGPLAQGSNDFRIQWSHAPVSRGNQSFSASVDLSSSNYIRNNEQNLNRYLSNVFGSSVQYSRNFGQLVTSSSSLRINQNVTTGEVTAGAGFNVGVNQFQPLKRKRAVTPAWYESFRLGLSLSATADLTNIIRPSFSNNTGFKVAGLSERVNPDTLGPTIVNPALSTQETRLDFFKQFDQVLKFAQVRTTYSIPVTLPNFKIARYINLTPSFSFQGDFYTKRLDFNYVDSLDAVRVDTTSGFFPTYNFSTAISLNTRVYGTFNFKNFGRLDAIRHTFAPSISLSYSPAFADARFDFYKNVQINRTGETRNLSRFTGYTGTEIQTYAASFSLVNTLEARVRAKSDTAKKAFEKINLLDNLSLNGSYNFAATEFKLSTITLNANTLILKKYNISFSSAFDPYVYVNDGLGENTVGRRVDRYRWQAGQGLAQLNAMNIAFSTSFQPSTDRKKKAEQQRRTGEEAGLTEEQIRFVQNNPQAYIDWSVPWTLSVNYNFAYAKYGLQRAQTTQTFNFSGDLSLTDKWKVTFSSGYDFVAGAPSLTQIGIVRNLHCWEATFNWTPIAQNLRSGNYNFELRVQSAILRDLKISRRRSFYDTGGF
jgi:lipopolysaccharide assembly outer membrane protein LptD (OstA)